MLSRIGEPALTFGAGCPLKVSFVAAPAVMLKTPELAEVSPVAAALNAQELPACVTLRSVKLAMPPDAFTVSVPLAPDWQVWILPTRRQIVTASVAPVTRLPAASVIH